MDVQVSQEIEILQSNRIVIENTKETLEAANAHNIGTNKTLETDNIETENTVDTKQLEEPVTNEDFVKDNEEYLFENESVDAENSDKRQKRYRSEKQRERTRQYKKKIRKMKRKMMLEIQNEEISRSMSQTSDDKEDSLTPSEPENRFVKVDPLLQRIERFPPSGKVSNLNVSAEVFVPNKGTSPEANRSTFTINDKVDKENGYNLNTCEYGMKARLAEQLETLRQNRLREEKVRAEKYNEIVRNMASIIPFLTAHFMASSLPGELLKAPNTMSQGNTFITDQTDAASPRYPQQRFEPNLRRHCEQDNQTKRKGFVILPSARNVPESLRISANSFLAENRQRVRQQRARTLQASRLKTTAEEFKQQTTEDRPVNDRTFGFFTNVPAENNLQDTEHVVQTSSYQDSKQDTEHVVQTSSYQDSEQDTKHVVQTSSYQDSEEFVSSVNWSTSTRINALHSVLDTRDPPLILTDSRDITGLETATTHHKSVSSWRTRADIFLQGNLDDHLCSYQTR